LSTQLNTEQNLSAQLSNDVQVTFDGLVEWLQSQSAPPSIEDISAQLAQVQITPADLQPYLGFKEGNYWRHRVCRNNAAEMLVICWRPGQKTPIHDHNGSHGVVRVQEGLMWETMFTYDDDKGLKYKSGRECPTGEITGAAEPEIHQLGNPDVSGQDLITIHIYAPPLGVLKTYKVGSANVDLYTPNDFPTE
jgi:cysteine dioxygenase